MTKLQDPIDDQELDRRLRDAFRTVMPMLDIRQRDFDAPTGTAGEFDLDAAQSVTANTALRRRFVPVLTAAAAMAVAIAGLVAIASRPDTEPVTQLESPPDTAPSSDQGPGVSVGSTATISTAVRGVPVCGAELPVAVEMLSATSGPLPGPATDVPLIEGQYAEYWYLPGGTIEFRWPPDPRAIYDLDSNSRFPSVFDAMTVGVPDDGTQADVKVSAIDPDIDSDPLVDRATLTMSATPSVAQLDAPCDLLQVRYIDNLGNQTTRGYYITDFNQDPMFGVDLNPLITSTYAGVAPDPETVVDCASLGIDTDVAGPPGATAADALLAFLDSGQVPGLMTSGYSEFTMSEAETFYAIIDDDRLITHITVTNTPEGWTVTNVKAPGC